MAIYFLSLSPLNSPSSPFYFFWNHHTDGAHLWQSQVRLLWQEETNSGSSSTATFPMVITTGTTPTFDSMFLAQQSYTVRYVY